ncbi:CBASS cGAMP-activated phospholipase [Candidatus Methylomirabilis sp.]|uniref:CBASS cGAMP-activated phospholipase n=1 Tax=Candidatus Methylomirabilis sp. TaxID=2032687 RepID=UPI00307675E7
MGIRRILTLDGGGIKGIFPVAFLTSIEQEVEGSISNYFDLIVGASTGGIIALGLGLGFTAKELLSFYEEFANQVFCGERLPRFFRRVVFSKYCQEPFRKALQEKFGDLKIGDSKIRLVIPTLNLETGKVYVYKTAHHRRFEKDYKECVVDVALATAAAPTYFPSHRNSSGTPLVDGGMWANNPTGFAVVEAIGVLGWSQGDLRVLSLGCTTSPLDVGIGRHIGMGQIYWACKVADVFMSGQSSASLGTAQLLAGHENVFRISPSLPAKRFSLDSIKETASLRGLGFSEAREALVRLRPVFFENPAEKFVPYHTEAQQ